jgi:hypothetical protein
MTVAKVLRVSRKKALFATTSAPRLTAVQREVDGQVLADPEIQL